MNGKFKILGVDKRTYENKEYTTVLLRDPQGTTHKVDAQPSPTFNANLDKEVMIAFALKWGKYSAGIEAVGVV